MFEIRDARLSGIYSHWKTSGEPTLTHRTRNLDLNAFSNSGVRRQDLILWIKIPIESEDSRITDHSFRHSTSRYEKRRAAK